ATDVSCSSLKNASVQCYSTTSRHSTTVPILSKTHHWRLRIGLSQGGLQISSQRKLPLVYDKPVRIGARQTVLGLQHLVLLIRENVVLHACPEFQALGLVRQPIGKLVFPARQGQQAVIIQLHNGRLPHDPASHG